MGKKRCRSCRDPHHCKVAMCEALSNKENMLLVLTITAVICGCVMGLLFRSANLSIEARKLLVFPGELLMNMLKMLMIPLIMSSLISGIAVLDTKSCGKISSCAMIYYMGTTIAAAILGIILVVVIHPGSPVLKEGKIGQKTDSANTLDTSLDLLRNMWPDNLVKAMLFQAGSKLTVITGRANKTITVNSTMNETKLVDLPPVVTSKVVYSDGTNVMGLVTFSIFLGLVISRMGKRAAILRQFFQEVNDAVLELVKIFIWFSPIGILCLIIGKFMDIKDLQRTAQDLGMYMLTVVLGLIIHACITLSLIFYVITRRSPFTYFRGMLQAWVNAVGTSSSSATLPITFKCLEENNHVDKRITRFVLPVGATINMDGTALYEAVAAIFIAQMNNVNLEFPKLVTISITATLASIGAASIPSAGLVTMVMVLTSVGLPVEDISLIVPVDWLLDRLRTSVNVLGDAFGAGIVERLCRDELEQTVPELDENENYQLTAVTNTPAHCLRMNTELTRVDATDGDEENRLDMVTVHDTNTNTNTNRSYCGDTENIDYIPVYDMKRPMHAKHVNLNMAENTNDSRRDVIRPAEDRYDADEEAAPLNATVHYRNQL